MKCVDSNSNFAGIRYSALYLDLCHEEFRKLKLLMQSQKESISYWHYLESSEKEAIRCKKLVRTSSLGIGEHKMEW